MKHGRRPRSGSSADEGIPAPYAEGDLLRVPPGAHILERIERLRPGVYQIVSAVSLDEGDVWYFRLHNDHRRRPTGELYVIHGGRASSYWKGTDFDALSGCELLETADPEGLAQREQMLADGWQFEPRVEERMAALLLEIQQLRAAPDEPATAPQPPAIATAAVAAASETVAPEGATPERVAPEEYAVYAALLPGPPTLNAITSQCSREAPRSSLPAEWLELGAEVQAAWDDFHRKPKSRSFLEQNFPQPCRCLLLSPKLLRLLFPETEAWYRFAERFGLLPLRTFSRVGFNREKTWAVLETGGSSGPLYGGGSLVLLRRTAQGWEVQDQSLLWVS